MSAEERIVEDVEQQDQRPEADQDGGVDLDENNIYVQELKKVFLSCDASGSGSLDENGLKELCEKLHLIPHIDFILPRILHPPLTESHRVSFSIFKRRFVQLLPEIVDLSASAVQPPAPTTEDQEDNEQTSPSRHDDDTSNDVLSDFSEDMLAAEGSPSRFTDATPDDHVTVLSRSIEKTLRDLGLASSGYLDRYETRILCQHTGGLSHLSPAEVNAIFEQIDVDRDGRISVADFLTGFIAKCDPPRVAPSIVTTNAIANDNAPNGSSKFPHDVSVRLRRSPEENFVSVGGDSALNLFQAIDSNNTGIVQTSALVELWSRAGLDVDIGRQVLKQLRIDDGETNALLLSAMLDHDLMEAVASSPILMAAALSFKAERDHLRSALMDAKCKSDHLHRELVAADRRRSMLIEELEGSQKTMEHANEQRFRELEERNRQRLSQMEERYRSEKDFLMVQLQQCEEHVREAREAESTARAKAAQVEREAARLRRETHDMTQTLQEMEQLNRELRHELQKSTFLARKAFGQNLENTNALPRDAGMWKHKAELLTAQNKRLKDRVDELMAMTQKRPTTLGGPSSAILEKHRLAAQKLTPYYARTSVPFRNQLLAIRRRRRLHEEKGTLSEMDSEPEPIFLRPRRKRPLSIKQRRVKMERRNQRMGAGAILPSSSSEAENRLAKGLEPTASFHLDRSISGVSGVQLKATLRKQLQHEAQLEFAGVEEAFAQEKSQILTRTNREVLRAREDGQKELQLVVQSSKRQMDDALRAQERLIMEKCEREKREMEIRWASERNALERAFAEEKMAMMSRLQEDFNMELRRTRMSSSVESVNSRGSQDKVAELTKQLKVLESSLNGQRNGYETKIEEIRHECDRQLAELRKQLDQQKAWSTAEDLPPRLSKLFYALLDDYKNRERAKLARDRDDFLDGLQNERAKLCESLENEKQRMNARHASQIEEMRRRADEQTALLDETRTECQNLRADLASIRSSSTDSARGDRAPVLFGEANTQTDEDDLPLVFPSSLSFPTNVADSTVQTNETLISISTTPTTSLASRFNHFVVDSDGGNVRPSRCAKCELVESRIKDIELAVQSDSAFESGVEDLGSSAESLEDANLLKRENGKMRRKLGLARQRLTDLRLCMTVSSSQEIRRRCAPNTFNIATAAALNGEWLPVSAAIAGRSSKSANTAYYEAAAVETSVGSEMERLQVENVLVDARLQETRALLQETVKKYQEQLRETGRLGLLIRRLCSSRKTM